VFKWRDQSTHKKRLQIFLALILSNIASLLLAIAFRGPYLVVFGTQVFYFLVFITIAHIRGKEILRNISFEPEVNSDDKPLVPFISLENDELTEEPAQQTVFSSPEDDLYVQKSLETSKYRGHALTRKNRSSLYLVPDQAELIGTGKQSSIKSAG